MGDFDIWWNKDLERSEKLQATITKWMALRRRYAVQPFSEEKAGDIECSDVLINFINERLSPTTGLYYIPKGTPPITLQDSLTVVTASFIDGVLKKAIPAYAAGNITWKPYDGRYWLPSQRDAWRVIQWSQVNTMPWTEEILDCDDHALDLQHDFRSSGLNSCAVIISRSAGHAFNMLFFPDGQYWFLEPQQDKIVSIGSGIYGLERGEIVL